MQTTFVSGTATATTTVVAACEHGQRLLVHGASCWLEAGMTSPSRKLVQCQPESHVQGALDAMRTDILK